MTDTIPSPLADSRVAEALPWFFENRGVWEGTHRVIGLDGRVIEESVRCVEVAFPVGAEFDHVSIALGPDIEGRRQVIGEVRGHLDGRQLRWDEPSFSGRAWDGEGLSLLEIVRKDDPGLRFLELITLSAGRRHRTRTLHWYRDGVSSHRTLCDEMRIDGDD